MAKLENQKHEHGISFAKLALFAGVLGLFGILATACGGSSGGSSAAAPPPVYVGPMGPAGACMGCPNNMNFLVSAVSQALDPMTGQPSPAAELGLDLFADTALMQQTMGYGGAGYIPGYFTTGSSYRGPVGASGYLALNQGLPSCGVPPGRYQLQTISVGMFGNDGAGRSVDNLVLGMMGSVPAQMILSGYTMPAAPPARGFIDGRTYPYRFVATTLLIKRMDNYATCNLNLVLQ